MSRETTIRIGLFEPGMDYIHRVGLAGLYMTLEHLDKNAFEGLGDWSLTRDAVELKWDRKPRDLLDALFKKSFGITKDGLISFLPLQNRKMGEVERILFHRAILLTYLQHGRTRTLSKNVNNLQIEFGEKLVTQSFRAMIDYEHQRALDDLISKDRLVKDAKIAGWAIPGGGVRHTASSFSEATTLRSPSSHFLALLYAPVASLYFLISHKGRDGKRDKRRAAAIVYPHISDLEKYSQCYRRYLDSPVNHLYADSTGDAGLCALASLNLFDPVSGMIQNLDVDSCSVVLFGTLAWSKQQKSRTMLRQLRHINKERLNLFSLAWNILPNPVRHKEDGTFYVQTSLARGLIAENVAEGSDWFRGFHRLMVSKQLSKAILYERKGLKEMVDKAEWAFDADRLLVGAVHKALRNRYGALAARAQKRGEAAQFGREFERIRTSLMRAKNAQTLRAELADLFARGGLNKTLQENWSEILPLFTGPDWQRARDLALLALASYSGQGAEVVATELQTGTDDENGEDDE